tara:strand:+ start:475 stop:846 length:372 start_codon:yes stop_codon:yes gene_type:complete
MNKYLQAMTLVTLITVLTGCVVAIGNEDYDDEYEASQKQQDRIRSMINNLDLGRGINAIEAEFGVPDFTDAFTNNGESVRVLRYRTHRTDSDGKTTRDETTPLVFIDDQLVGWGELAIEKAMR